MPLRRFLVVVLLGLYLLNRQTDATRLKWLLRSGDVLQEKDSILSPMTPVDVAKQYGYKTETHTVTTSDGYILAMHRIQNGSVRVTEPFILQHGLSCNSGQWLVLEPSQNLALLLADNGYDVWLTNIRGSMYSRKNERLSPDTGEFWDYGWHEHGTIDMPTMIDYILIQTGYKQLFYAGHSMGTTMFFVMGSMRPDYNAKIKHMFALAPVAYMGNLKSPFRSIASETRTIREVLKVTNNHLPSEVIAARLAKIGVCRLSMTVCSNALDVIGGPNPNSNQTVQQGFYRYFPDAASGNQLAHYAQLINNPGSFRLFDYYEMNMAKYGYFVPPEYPVHKISALLTFFYSNNDYLTDNKDVESFSSKLRNVRMINVQDPNFNHFDFVIATHAVDLVYTPLLNIANSYRTKYSSASTSNMANTQVTLGFKN